MRPASPPLPMSDAQRELLTVLARSQTASLREVRRAQALLRAADGMANYRFRLHVTPTSSSWLNLVERWFRELTDKALRRDVFHSVPDLITAIEDYLTAHNQQPRPFIWTATPDDILARVARGRVALAKSAKTETQH